MVDDHDSNQWSGAWDEFAEDPHDGYCYRCDDTGTILVCVDDMCRGAGECIHGDGEIISAVTSGGA